jgi:hypothetical protein
VEVIPGTPEEETKPRTTEPCFVDRERNLSYGTSAPASAIGAIPDCAAVDHSSMAAGGPVADHPGDSSLPAVSGSDSGAQCQSFAFAPAMAVAEASTTPNLKFGGGRLAQHAGSGHASEQDVQEEVRRSLAGTCLWVPTGGQIELS